MPRNRPGALRAAAVAFVDPPPRIRGLSAAASLDVHRAECERPSFFLRPGATGLALRRYRAFLHPFGGRPLYPRESLCPSCPGCAGDDVRHSRDVLGEVLLFLPGRSRAELGRLVRPLDAEFRRRTLPDPFAGERLGAGLGWWHWRLGESAWDR
ncbi:hypothetical protein ACFYS8_15615 [Kitasatospora sp. NPDC004615]|uniref:hypothetical protein n=1 Tax=Kitasatospora sp. NPDC004615 TaxID=3364017 RepID=UPI00369BE862